MIWAEQTMPVCCESTETHIMLLFIVVFLLSLDGVTTSSETYPTAPTDVVIFLLSQPSSHHASRVADFMNQVKQQTKPAVTVHLLHEKWPAVGSWSVLPTLQNIAMEYGSYPWVFFCEDDTKLAVGNLLDVLSKYDPNKDWFIGHALHDREPTIIHHFAFINNVTSFHFPSFTSGFALSMPLVEKLSKRLDSSTPRRDHFTIDAKHELAMFIWDHGSGVTLTDEPQFCAGQGPAKCASTFEESLPDCGSAISDDDLYVAVKTCSLYHETRVPVVQKTWLSEGKTVVFYSDVEDVGIPTVDTGVPNTEQGHCEKTLAILALSYEAMMKKNIPWMILVDDDTVISLNRLRQLLACYDENEAVVLGERYAFGVGTNYAYDYITGGGGTVMSYTALELLLGSERCHCGKRDSPDDMTLGICFQRLAIPLLHSSLFHQARPDDYATDYLKYRQPVSFHKHWNIDPIRVYEDYLNENTGNDQEKKYAHEEF